MAGIGKNEDRVALAVTDVLPLHIVRSYAGWIVSTEKTAEAIAQLPEQHLALMGQAADRVPAVMIDAQTADGTVIQQSYVAGRGEIAELILQLVATFLDRDMFKQLVAALPEEWSRG